MRSSIGERSKTPLVAIFCPFRINPKATRLNVRYSIRQLPTVHARKIQICSSRECREIIPTV